MTPSLRSAVFKLLDAQRKPFEWPTRWIMGVVGMRTGRGDIKKKTVLRYFHEYADMAGGKFELMGNDRHRFTPGFVVGESVE